MKNIMSFPGGYHAAIVYDPDINLFRGEFLNLNGGADFYAKDIDTLREEGQKSLDVFLRMCQEDGVPPKKVQGKFSLRLEPEVHEAAILAAASSGKSLNQWVAHVVARAARLASEDNESHA